MDCQALSMAALTVDGGRPRRPGTGDGRWWSRHRLGRGKANEGEHADNQRQKEVEGEAQARAIMSAGTIKRRLGRVKIRLFPVLPTLTWPPGRYLSLQPSGPRIGSLNEALLPDRS
jgi:hypothetical protein